MSQFISRRNMLFQAGGGISGLALANLLGTDGLLAAPTAGDQACVSGPQNSATAPRKPHFKPRAKAVISLFMTGGVSHIDTFDPKPILKKYHGQPLTGFGEIVVSWVTYGLGSENQNLPAFVVIYDHRGGPNAGVSNWNNGFLPTAYQGTIFRPTGDPILDLRPPAG